MTPSQDKLYWREWASLTRRCKAKGDPIPDRHDLHRRALRSDKSHTKFTNEDFDKVLGVFRSWPNLEDMRPILRADRQPRHRLEHKIVIEQTALLSVVLNLPAEASDAKEGPQLVRRSSERRRIPDPGSAIAYCLSPIAYSPSAQDRSLAAENYIINLMQQRFHTSNIKDISDEIRPRGPGKEEKSDLECLRDTLAARINTLRNQRGLTIKEMRELAGLAKEDPAAESIQSIESTPSISPEPQPQPA